MLIPFNIPLSRVCTVAYEVDFRPKILAHILQYMDFFAYSRSRAILTDDKQLHCRLRMLIFSNGSAVLSILTV